jgi:hypothetical protein
MSETFYIQREDIYRGALTAEMIEDWPLIHKTRWLIRHFEILGGVNVTGLLVADCTTIVVRFSI